ATNPHQREGYGFALLSPGPELAARVGLATRGTLLPTFAGNGWVVPDDARPLLAVVGVTLAAGVAVIARQRGIWAASLLVAPVLAALGASALRLYPMGVPRLMMFASPLLVVLAAAAIGGLAALADGRGRPAIALVATIAVTVPMAASVRRAMRSPWRGEDAP